MDGRSSVISSQWRFGLSYVERFFEIETIATCFGEGTAAAAAFVVVVVVVVVIDIVIGSRCRMGCRRKWLLRTAWYIIVGRGGIGRRRSHRPRLLSTIFLGLTRFHFSCTRAGTGAVTVHHNNYNIVSFNNVLPLLFFTNEPWRDRERRCAFNN